MQKETSFQEFKLALCPRRYTQCLKYRLYFVSWVQWGVINAAGVDSWCQTMGSRSKDDDVPCQHKTIPLTLLPWLWTGRIEHQTRSMGPGAKEHPICWSLEVETKYSDFRIGQSASQWPTYLIPSGLVSNLTILDHAYSCSPQRASFTHPISDLKSDFVQSHFEYHV